MRPEARTSSQLGRRTSADVPWLECDEVVQECGGVRVLLGGSGLRAEALFQSCVHSVTEWVPQCILANHLALYTQVVSSSDLHMYTPPAAKL